MYWQVIIPQKGRKSKSESNSVTIEADNWLTALKNGLEKQGQDGKLISNVSCQINPDKSVTVTDFVTRKSYILRPVDGPAEGVELVQTSAPRDSGLPQTLSGDFSPHQIFFWRDEDPDDGSGIFYRERLIEVEEGYQVEEASRLVHAYFEHLKELGTPNGFKLFISVQVYDHSFEEQSSRPAVAALTWREWSPKKPRILFPLSGTASVTFSKIPPPAKDKTKPQPKTISSASEPINNKPAAATSATARRPAKTKRKRPSGELSLDDKMVRAFERMQDIYKVRDWDKAAQFVLSLARELIECESGKCMLTKAGKYELYVSAAEGPGSEAVLGQRISFRKGIVGSATRSGAVINIKDPQSDKRFDSEIDQREGQVTRSVLCAPVQYEGRIRGAIELLNSVHSDGFTQNETNILSYLGGALAEYITNSLPSREKEFTDREFVAGDQRHGKFTGKKLSMQNRVAAHIKPLLEAASASGSTVPGNGSNRAVNLRVRSGSTAQSQRKPLIKSQTDSHQSKPGKKGS